PLLIDEHKEERLVLDDRSANAPTELVPVFVVLLNVIEIVEPCARVESGVAIRPEHAAAELVGSGASDHLHLSRSARAFGVNGGRDDITFLDGARTGVSVGECPKDIPPVETAEPAASPVRRAAAPAGKEAGTCRCVALRACTCCRVHEVHNVAASERE